ncbi:MAG: lipoate--protein ligase family protein [Candidatus Micrarchaeota archaeon]|nr:lipoate--protein ligase family protein [Candidatus Micrarchaeota archaeon]
MQEDNWRVIKVSAQDAALNMALDEAVCRAISKGVSGPTVRFYTWSPSAVSIGYFQEIWREVDIDYCRKMGISFVRRRTGGGAVYHDSQGEITYSVLAPECMFPKGIIESYKVICGWIIDGLAGVGISAEFRPINDIVAGGKKISGNAQTRRDGVLQQHGTILYRLDVDTMFKCLKVPDAKIRDKMIQSAKERVTSASDLTQGNVSFDGLYKSLLNAFCAGKKFSFGSFTQEELADAYWLARTKYSSDEWNFWR